MPPTRFTSTPVVSHGVEADDAGAVKSVNPYLLVWVATTVVITLVVWVINDRYAEREIEREAQALERTVEYVAVVIAGEVARLDENAKAIAEHRQGGEIVFESELGAGSTFRVRIPRSLPADVLPETMPRGL